MTAPAWRYPTLVRDDSGSDDRPRLQLVGQEPLFWPGDFNSDIDRFAASWTTNGLSAMTASHYVRHLRKYQHAYPGQGLTLANARELIAAETARYASVGRWTGRALKAFDAFLGAEYDQPMVLARMKIPRPKQPSQSAAPIAFDDDIALMLNTCHRGRFRDLRDRAIIHTFRSTGMRLGEVVAMGRSDLDLTTGRLIVHTLKNGPGRTARLDSRAMNAMRDYLSVIDEGEAIWRKDFDHTAMGRSGVSSAIRRRAQIAKTGLTPHSFRRGFAVRWLRAGGSQTFLKTLAGWTSDCSIDIYVRTIANDDALVIHEQIFG